MATKFTFKKGVKETGLAAIGNPYAYTTIRLKGKDVGSIVPPSRWDNYQDNKWSIRLHVVDAEKQCGWKNITLKARFDTEPEAREFINLHADAIFAKGLNPLDR